uniref:Low-density lipoprotein receptor domain class A n=1 Tax=Setaria digitata TaxID=48799 RepID=A0A915Q671_9BILA
MSSLSLPLLLLLSLLLALLLSLSSILSTSTTTSSSLSTTTTTTTATVSAVAAVAVAAEIIKFSKRRILLIVLLILPLQCSATVTKHPVITETTNNQLNSGIAIQISDIISHNLDTARQVPSSSSKLITKNHNSTINQNYHQHCPLNAFRCGDGICIPQDWINDGEADCNDLTDEMIQSTTILSVNDKTLLSERNTEQPFATMEETADDPFDRIVTFPSTDHLSLSNSPLLHSDKSENPSSTRINQLLVGCSNSVQMRVNQCSTDLTDWLENLDQVDLTNSSMLNDETSF